ncbi:unnamed protein product [Ectocarpus fasciculatus]
MVSSIQFERLSDDAKIPRRSREKDAGYDLFSSTDVSIPAGSTRLVKTDICMRLPDPPMKGMSVYGQICERSGLALKSALSVRGGVVDRGYTGNVGIVLRNNSGEDFSVGKGDRVAQLLVCLIMTPTAEEVSDISSDVTERGASGFGSSGTS